MELLGSNMLVASDVNLVNLHLLLFVDIDIYYQLVIVCRIIMLDDLYVSILETLVIEILLDDNLSLVYHVRSNLITLDDTHLLVEVIAFALSHTVDVHLRNTRTHGKHNLQIYLIVHDAVSLYSHCREESVLPVSLYSLSDVIARHRYLFAYSES